MNTLKEIETEIEEADRLLEAGQTQMAHTLLSTAAIKAVSHKIELPPKFEEVKAKYLKINKFQSESTPKLEETLQNGMAAINWAANQ